MRLSRGWAIVPVQKAGRILVPYSMTERRR
jgi:hypothetical protein